MEKSRPSVSSPYAGHSTTDEAAERFEAAWRNGEQPQIENYLGGVTGEKRAALLRELLAVELELRRRDGECPAPEEYCRRFPDDQELIRLAFAESLPLSSSDRARQVDSPAPDRLVWYYAQGKTKVGPLTGEQLRQLAAAGRLRPTEMVWQQGSPRWLEAASVPGLFVTEDDLGQTGAIETGRPGTPETVVGPDAGLTQKNPSQEAASPVPDPTWPVISGYEILGVLGQGGMGVVYKGRQEKLAPGGPQDD